MMQKLNWVCNKCGWEHRIDYHPSPQNLDAMLERVPFLHRKEEPLCNGTARDIICHHV